MMSIIIVAMARARLRYKYFNKSVKKYVDEGKVNAYVPIPSDHRSTLAAYMQKYLAGELDRTELAGYLDDYWKNH